MAKKDVLRKNPDVVTRDIEGETILLPVYKITDETNSIFTLNPAASRVWKLIDGKRSLDQIKKLILKEFNTTAQEVDKKMGSLLKDLKKIKAVV